MTFELAADHGTQLGIQGGQHLWQPFDLGDAGAADGECLGHLNTDAPGADDGCAVGSPLGESCHHSVCVVDRAQRVHPVTGAECGVAGE